MTEMVVNLENEKAGSAAPMLAGGGAAGQEDGGSGKLPGGEKTVKMHLQTA